MVDTVIIGGGPAGMMAAYAALQKGEKVLLLEQNNRLGRKLLITGKGRCNITNDADIGDFIGQVPVNSRFLYSAFYSFTNDQLLDLLHEYGLETKVERGGRVFPVSDRSSDVLRTLQKLISGAEIRLNTRVRSILINDGKITGVSLWDKTEIKCNKVVLATGGISYPVTGSRGDGYKIAEQVGHSVVSPKASLVPLETEEEWCKDLQGLSLRNIVVKVTDKRGKEVYSDFGEMVFTHFGVSGPVILSASSHIRKIDGHRLTIDLKPALSEEQLDARLLRDFQTYSNRDFCNGLDDLLPKKLIPVIVSLSGIPEHCKIHQIAKEQRQVLVSLCKSLSLTLTATRPVEEAIITSGGINVKEINPSTMESKKVRGLYFAGEVIDVDAYTGGFNLQIAFSTGFLAGQS
ncbi:MAG: NAD(P)/FAD-dependent oxidoreductase [Ruminococcaceae bacterium]|nr:NAD(P)/FAD-dependent oxidoreductase [Oscillospiraceae bacterium]